MNCCWEHIRKARADSHLHRCFNLFSLFDVFWWLCGFSQTTLDWQVTPLSFSLAGWFLVVLPNSNQNNRKHLSGYILKFSIIRIDFFFIAGNGTPWLSLAKRISVFLVLYCYGNKRSEPCGNHIVTNTVENEKRLLDDLISHQQKLVQKKRQRKREINVWLKVKYAWDSFMCGCVGGLQWIAPLYYYSVNCTTRF